MIPEADQEYAFRFDVPLEPVLLGGRFDLHGWLLHREGKPIHGLRAVVRRRFGRPQILKGRRKRKRLDVAAAFPHLPDAEASGFLIELRLGLGRNDLEFQVLDHARVWQTFASATVSSLPLNFLERAGLTNVRGFVLSRLKHRFATNQRATGNAHLLAETAGRSIRTKRVDLFATSKSNLFIVEIGELLAAGFRELGCDAQLHLDGVPVATPPDDTVQIVVTPHEYYNLFLSEKLPRQKVRKLTGGVHLFCTEQPETGWFQSNLQWGAYARSVADISPLGAEAYRARGLVSRHLQLGYHPMLEHDGRRPHAERTHDITFLGSMTDRRDLFFAEHAQFFAQHRCHLRLVPLGFAKTKETRSYLSEERRNALLSESRILLNLHYSEQKYFEWHRMLAGLANGCCIITETCQGYGALVPGEHFIMVEPEHLIPSCAYFLAHPQECEKIARAGREFIETHLRQAQSCRAFLSEIERGETLQMTHGDAAEIPLSADLFRTLSHHSRAGLLQALQRDLRSLGYKVRSRSPVANESSVSAPASFDQTQRAAVITKREAYRARLTQQEKTITRGEAAWQLHDNAAFAGAAEPKLTALITLYNYAEHIGECVASIEAAAARFPAALEVVIVDDGSTDFSPERARELQGRSPLPMRVVAKQFNTGLADARNVGLRIARAPYVLMMDADNLIYPEALTQLFAVISTGDKAAAYSMLCRFRGDPSRRVGLLSYFDWDPQILVQYPYIDAMAMFDRRVLLELGGYDNQLSQIGWFGWEDYDMWLRIAQHDLPVGFVPNTLCLYRQHETSMINTTNLFESELVHHFMEHYGELLSRFAPREKAFGVERAKIAEFCDAQL